MNIAFHHIAVATNDLVGTTEFYRNMGFGVSDPVIDYKQSVTVAFIRKDGHPDMELVSPIGERSPITNVLKKVGVTPYHVCYEVDNIEEAISYFRENKFIIAVQPMEAAAFDNRKIAFVFSKSVGLLELLEK